MDQPDNMSKGDKINAKLDCRTENVNIELANLVEQACNSGMFSPSQEKALENGRDHAHRARERTKAAGGFKGLGRKQKSNCYVEEAVGVDGNEDGVCTSRGNMRETCAEVAGDGIGDDDGLCETMGNRKEVCVEICDSSLNDQDDDNFDDEAARDMEVALMDLEIALVESNEAVALAVKAYAQARQFGQISSPADDACFVQPPWVAIVTGALTGASILAEGSLDICSSVAGQTAAGFNALSSCTVFAVAKLVINVTLAIFRLREEDVTKSGYEIQYSCAGQTSNAVADVDSDVAVVDTKATNTEARANEIDRKVDELNVRAGNTEGKVNEIDEKVNALNARVDEVLELLRTPPGRREGFPKP